jgi:hypothetical protein
MSTVPDAVERGMSGATRDAPNAAKLVTPAKTERAIACQSNLFITSQRGSYCSKQFTFGMLEIPRPCDILSQQFVFGLDSSSLLLPLPQYYDFRF